MAGSQTFGADEPHWHELFAQRLAVLNDTLFDTLSQVATEVRTRVRLDPDTRTVIPGHLWYEENLPAETLLWGLVAMDRARRPATKPDDAGSEPVEVPVREAAQLLKPLPANHPLRIQVGGNATVGRGQALWRMTDPSR